MSLSFVRFSILASFLALAGCALPQANETDEVAVDEEALQAGALDYFRLESITPVGGSSSASRYTVSLVNGGKMVCPAGGYKTQCIVDAVVLPQDCDWECRDGILSLRGVTLFRGQFTRQYDKKAHAYKTGLNVTAGFDTFDSSIGNKPVYRITQETVYCFRAPCPTRYVAKRVNGGPKKVVANVDFSNAHDPNYVLDSSRGFWQMTRKEGLLVSGNIVAGVFNADRVWRQWTPVADCDVVGAAKAYFFEAPEADEVNQVFATTSQAETFQDPEGRQVNWLVRTENKGTSVAFIGGRNDLWSQTFDVDTVTCAVTLTGEH